MAGRSSVLVIVLAFALLGSLLFFSGFQSKKSEVVNYPANVSTEPKIPQIQAFEISQTDLESKLGGLDGVRLILPYYNFSSHRYNNDQEYADYFSNNHLTRGWPIAEVNNHKDLLNLPLYLIRPNGTVYTVDATTNSIEKGCDVPSVHCVVSAGGNASRGHLVYRTIFTLETPYKGVVETAYMIDAETGKILWNSIDDIKRPLPFPPNVNFSSNKTIAQYYEQREDPPVRQVIFIVDGSPGQNVTSGYSPNEIKLSLGVDNKVWWMNGNGVMESIVSDTGYVDKLTGKKFDSGVIPPGGIYEFTFTEPGVYSYHGEPHPWMRGKIVIVGPYDKGWNPGTP